MPYTGNPATVQSDEVRLLMGDTDPSTPILSDAEILYYMGLPAAKSGGATISVRAAWLAVQGAIAKYAKMMSVTVGPTTVNYQELVDSLKETAASLEEQGGRPGALRVGAPVDSSSTVPSEIGDATWRNNRTW